MLGMLASWSVWMELFASVFGTVSLLAFSTFSTLGLGFLAGDDGAVMPAQPSGGHKLSRMGSHTHVCGWHCTKTGLARQTLERTLASEAKGAVLPSRSQEGEAAALAP